MDIRFKQNNKLFSYRVVGIIIKDNKVLMQRAIGDESWDLPGGRCKYNETSIDAIKREMSEEIKVTEIVDLRLLWIIEDFYNFKDEKVHELALYYKLDIKDDELICELETLEIQEEDTIIEFKWFDLDNIDKEDIKPELLKKKLLNITDNIEHIIEIEYDKV